MLQCQLGSTENKVEPSETYSCLESILWVGPLILDGAGQRANMLG